MQARDRRGFTLLEIMLALLILGVALVPMMGMFTTAHLGLKHGSVSTEALGLAQGKMEELKVRFIKGDTLVDEARHSLQPGYDYAVHIGEGTRPLQAEVVVYYQVNGQEQTLSLLTRMGDWK